MIELDAFDKHLLQLLQQNNRMTASELGDQVGLSPSAVQRRLTRLRDEKIIQADVSIISPEVVGLGITCIVDVILVDGCSGSLEKFKSSIQGCTEVTQCYYVTGTYDFVLIVHARDMKQYDEFSRRRLAENSNVKHFYTHVVMDSVKVGYGVPV